MKGQNIKNLKDEWAEADTGQESCNATDCSLSSNCMVEDVIYKATVEHKKESQEKCIHWIHRSYVQKEVV